MIDKEIRKKLGLPITKDIIYIYPRHGEHENETVKVKSIKVFEPPYTTGGYSLLLELENGDEVCCHSLLLKSVQCGVRYKESNNDVNVWDLDRLSSKLGW